MIRHAIAQIETAEPPIREVQMHFLAEATLGPDSKAIPDQEHTDQQLGINRWAAGMAVEFCQMGTDAAQIDEPVNGSKQVIRGA